MTKPPSMSASDVIAKLEAGIFKAPAHAILREVRNGTGYAGTTRTADALVVSLWPSRGVWFAGVEIKVSRGDWLRELKDPEKSTEIQRFCNYWWIATPPGVAKIEELPETWGLIEVNAKCAVLKQAPKLEAEPLSPIFVAAILRNRADRETELLNNARFETRQAVSKELGVDTGDIQIWQTRVKALEIDLEVERSCRQSFEKASGVAMHPWNGHDIGQAVKLTHSLLAHAN